VSSHKYRRLIKVLYFIAGLYSQIWLNLPRSNRHLGYIKNSLKSIAPNSHKNSRATGYKEYFWKKDTPKLPRSKGKNSEVLPYLNNRFLEVAKTVLKTLLSSLTCSQIPLVSCGWFQAFFFGINFHHLAENQNSQKFE
jgi:hypothetical protein